jgi:hypothetical protein
MEVRASLRDFLLRPYAKDIEELNSILPTNKKGAQALKEERPPIPFSGNPFLLTPGHCIAVLGINPNWNEGDFVRRKNEYDPLKSLIDGLRAGDVTCFDQFIRQRASFFSEDSKIYYGPYFSRLGGYIARAFFPDNFQKHVSSQRLAKEVFSKLVFKSDILPWFSRDASLLNPQALRRASAEPLQAWFALLRSFLVFLRPQFIQVNGFQMHPLASRLLNVQFASIALGEDRYCFGWCKIERDREIALECPVLMHWHSSAPGMSSKRFQAIAHDFQERTRLTLSDYRSRE